MRTLLYSLSRLCYNKSMTDRIQQRIGTFLWIKDEVFDNPSLSGSDIMVYASLMRHMNNKTKECFPSIKTLRIEARIRKRNVMYSLDKLEEAGLIYRKRTRGKVNRYIILEPGGIPNRTSANGNLE